MKSIFCSIEVTELGVTIFKFEFPGSEEQFIEAVNSWRTSTIEGNRYQVKKPEQGTLLKFQRGKGILTGPIVIEFEIGAALGLSTDVLARGYVKMFGIRSHKRDLRSDAMYGSLPRRNGWKDMLKLLDFVGISTYEYKFQ